MRNILNSNVTTSGIIRGIVVVRFGFLGQSGIHDNNKCTCVEFNPCIENSLKYDSKTPRIEMTFRVNNHQQNLVPETEKIISYKRGYYITQNVQISVALPLAKPVYPLDQDTNSIDQLPKLNFFKSAFAQHLMDYNHSMGYISDDLYVLHLCKIGWEAECTRGVRHSQTIP